MKINGDKPHLITAKIIRAKMVGAEMVFLNSANENNFDEARQYFVLRSDCLESKVEASNSFSM